MRITLGAEGYDVFEAEDGMTAKAALTEASPDLILQDLILPDVGGIDLVRWFRAQPAAKDIPIIAVSGFQSELQLAEKTQVGFTDFLFKPVDPDYLVVTVKSYLPTETPQKLQPEQIRKILMADDDPVQLKIARL